MTAVILLPTYLLVNFQPVAMFGAAILATIASVVLEYTIINHLVYKAVNEYHRQEIFNFGFNGSLIVIVTCLLMTLTALAAQNELLFFLSFFGYFMASSAMVSFRCSQTRYRSYLKEWVAKSSKTTS